jgi:hypothetical protein
LLIKVCVHLDPAEDTLVAGAAREEHCGLDPATLVAVGGQPLGRQVLILRGTRPLALFTVTAENGPAGTPMCPGAVTVRPEGLARLGAAPVAARLRRRFSRA